MVQFSMCCLWEVSSLGRFPHIWEAGRISDNVTWANFKICLLPMTVSPNWLVLKFSRWKRPKCLLWGWERKGRLGRLCPLSQRFFFFLAALGLHWCSWAFSIYSKWGPLSSCSTWAFHCSGCSCYGAPALGYTGYSSCGTGLVAPQHVASSQTRDWTHVPYIDKWSEFLATGPPGKSSQHFSPLKRRRSSKTESETKWTVLKWKEKQIESLGPLGKKNKERREDGRMPAEGFLTLKSQLTGYF